MASIVTTRSSRPIVGVARHTVKAAAVAPAAVGWKLKLVIPPAVILMPGGAAACAFSRVPLRMTQPCSQPPDPAQVSPSADMHSVTTALRLSASLRARYALAARSLADARN